MKRLSLFFRSIRFRLALWFVVVLGIVIVAFSAFIYYRQVQDLKGVAVARLEIKTRRLAGFIRFANQDYFDHTPLQLPSDPGSGDSLLQEGDELAFINTKGVTVQSWGPINTNGINQLVANAVTNTENQMAFTQVVVGGQKSPSRYMWVVAPVASGNNPIGFFLLGTPIDPNGQLPRLLVTFSLGLLLILGVALAGGVWLADRAMRPVKTITEAAQNISETDLSLRLHMDSQDELGQLANTFDAMLDRLQASFERLRQFTADASHELRTPLTIIDLEASRALATQRHAQEYERSLKVIHSENRFMSRMVTNLLTLARMDAGQVTLHKEPVDLSDVALEVVERLAPIAKKEQVRLSAGDLPELLIRGDRQYLVQMLSNLVENAIKYCRAEDRRIQVEAGSRSSKDGALACVRVIDNGIGIAPEHLPHLFDRFYQVDKARTRQNNEAGVEEKNQSQEKAAEVFDSAPSGTGLGLSIARWIAQAHGGEINVESEPGKGSTFEVSIPLANSKNSEIH
jgi:signal transduction histidine kinase